MELISICLCTYKRKSLRECLQSLQRLKAPENTQIEIIITDNDDTGSGRATVDSLGGQGPYPITYEIEPQKGIPYARNRNLKNARGRWIASLDDDEVVDPDWIEAHYKTARQFDAQAVIGAVEPLFATDPPRWALDSGAFARAVEPTGTPVSHGRTGNAFFDADFVRRHDLWFDERYAGTNGEDSDFFRRFQKLGGKMVSCAEAPVYEAVPPDRLTMQYIVGRSVHKGEIYALNNFARRDIVSRSLQFIASLAKSVSAALGALLTWPFAQGLSTKLFVSSLLNLGKIRYLFGFKPMAFYG